MNTRILSQALRALAVAAWTVEVTLPSQAITNIWTGGGSTAAWSDDGNWGGSAPSFSAGDTADLSTVNLSAATTSTISSPTTLGTLLIGDTDNTHAYTLNGSALTLDNLGAGANIIQSAGSAPNRIDAPFALTEDLTLVNASTNQFNVFGPLTGEDNALWFDSTIGGTIRLEYGGIGNGIKEICQNGNGPVRIATSISMSGDMTIRIMEDGTAGLVAEQAPLGTGDLYLVNDALSLGNLYIGGVNNIGLIYHSGTSTVGDQINGNVGTNVVSIIQQSATSQLDIRGGTFNLNSIGISTLVNNGGRPINLKQSTTGAGTLVLRNNTTTESGVFTGEGTLAHIGGVISDGTGTGSALITSHIGTSITNITQSSSTSQLNLYDGTFNVNPGGITVVNNGGARIDFKENVVGTGDLILKNNTTVNDAIYYKEKLMNHLGAVINTGTGTGQSRLYSNSKIGANVTEIVQDSPTSAFLVEGSLATSPFVGNVTVKQGTLQLKQSGYLTTNAVVSIDSGSVLNLNFIGTNVIGALFFNGVPKAKGIYNNANSGGLITGNGALEVLVSPLFPTVILVR